MLIQALKSKKTLLFAMALAGLSLSPQADASSYSQQSVYGNAYMDTGSNGVLYSCANIGQYKWCLPVNQGGDVFANLVTAAVARGKKVNVSCNSCYSVYIHPNVIAYLPESFGEF